MLFRSDVAQRKAIVKYIPSRAFDVPELVLDCTKIRRDLGWSPSVTLEAGLKVTSEWMNLKVIESSDC